MADDPEPTRKYYELKPRHFERANPTAVPGPQFHPPEPQLPEKPSTRIDVKDIYRTAATPGRILNPTRRPTVDAEVGALLTDNHRREVEAGLHKVTYQPPRKSRRIRDYIVIVIATLIVFGGLAVWGAATRNAVLFIYSVAAIGLILSSAWWVMYQVMDKY